MSSKPFISIIIPAYNAADNLHQCLDSVLDQRYAHFEILLINDGSLDGTKAVCEAYAAKDKRVRAFHKENGGVGSARNVGLQHVQGDFICFLDADDWIEPDYFEQFIIHQERGTALIIFNHYVNRKHQVTKKFSYPNMRFSRQEFSAAFIDLNFLRIGYICSKFFSAAIVKQHLIAFNEEIHYAEDLLFILEYIKYIDTIKYTDYTGYHYMHYNPDSLSKTHNSFESEYKGFQLLAAQLDVLVKSLSLKPEAQVYINIWLGRFFLRAVQTFYHNNADIPLQERLRLLKLAHRPENVKYLQGIETLKLPAHILASVYMYKRKRFLLYDQFLRLIFKLHRLKMNAALVNR